MMYDRDEQAKDEQALARSLEGFRKSWSPENPHDARHFETELYYLIETVRRVSQQPLIKQMSAAMALIPSPFLVHQEQINRSAAAGQTMSAVEHLEDQLAKAARSRDMKIMKLDAQNKELTGALHEALLTIKALHGPVAWDIYERNAPEMKRIHAALDAAK